MNISDMEVPFIEFPKIARLSRECIITEKIDGTNASIHIPERGMPAPYEILAGSRTLWLYPGVDDNKGFRAWVMKHKDELLTLGPGTHFGEWWGSGIGRGYGLKEKRFSLFNTARWCLHGTVPQRIGTENSSDKIQEVLPPCCGLVPTLYRGMFSTLACDSALQQLKTDGSQASPGFMNPEGIVCYHVAGNVGFKKTLDKNDTSKFLV